MKPTFLRCSVMRLCMSLLLFINFSQASTGQEDCPPTSGITFSNLFSLDELRKDNNDIGYAGFQKANKTYAVLASTDLSISTLGLTPYIQLSHLETNGLTSSNKLWDNDLPDQPRYMVPIQCHEEEKHLIVGHTGINENQFFVTAINPNATTSSNYIFKAEKSARGYHIALGRKGTHFAAVGSLDNQIFVALGTPCEEQIKGFSYKVDREEQAVAHAITEVKDIAGLQGPAPYYAITGQVGTSVFLMVINSSGGVEFGSAQTYSISSSSSTIGLGIVQTPDRTISITGTITNKEATYSTIFLLDVVPNSALSNPLGNVSWIYSYNIKDSQRSTPNAILINQLGNYIIAGKNKEVISDRDTDQGIAFLMEVTAGGRQIDWIHEYLELEGSSFEDVRLTEEGGYFCTGHAFTNRETATFYDVFTVKTDSIGRIANCDCYQPTEAETKDFTYETALLKIEPYSIQPQTERFIASKELEATENPCYVYECATVACPPDTCITLAMGLMETVVTFPPAPVACEELSIVYNPPSGSIFSCGTTTVTCTATDRVTGEVSICTFDITIKCEPTCCQNEEEFNDRVALGFSHDLDIETCKLTVVPNALDSCYQVYWVWDNSTTEGPFAWNDTVCHTYTTPGIYDVCMIVSELKEEEICWEAEYCEQIEVDCGGCQCDEEYATTLATDILTNHFQLLDAENCVYAVDVPALEECYEVFIDWGDTGGTYQNVPVATSSTHTYAANGTYTVCIEIRLEDGTVCHRLCKEIEVNCGDCRDVECDRAYAEGLATDILFNHFMLIDAERCVYAVNVPALKECYEVFINWGETGGTYQNVPVATSSTHTYAANGTYTVCIEIRLEDGTVCHRLCREIEVNCGDCRNIECDRAYAEDLATDILFNHFVLIDAENCVYAVDVPALNECYEVFIGWGNTGGIYQNVPVATNITHTYPANGTYTVCIEVRLTDGTVCYQLCREITIDCGSGGLFSCGMSVATCYADPYIGGGPVGVIYDIRPNESAPVGADWANASLGANQVTEIHPAGWDLEDIGQVFGIAIDNSDGDIFLAATDIYRLDAGGLSYNPGPAGPAGIYRTPSTNINSTSTFVATTSLPATPCDLIGNNQIPNTGNTNTLEGNGIGNIAYDQYNDQLFATNTEDGRIYQIDSNTGNILGIYDPFSSGVDAAGIETVAGELLWGIGVFEEEGAVKVYFSRQMGTNIPSEIWSVTLNAAGNFPGTPTAQCIHTGAEILEIGSLPTGGQAKVTDLAFSTSCRMLISERGNPHDAHVYEYSLINSVWTWQKEYFIGRPISPPTYNSNSAGGVDFGYLERDGNQFAGCDSLVWASGNYMRTSDGLVYGLQGITQGCNMPQNINTTDLFIDLDHVYNTLQKYEVGDVEVFRCINCPKPDLNCEDLMVLLEETSVTEEECCYTVDLKNNVTATITKVEIELITPGWAFNTQILDANFMFNGAPTNTSITLEHTSGSIPSGNSLDVLELCLNNLAAPYPPEQTFVIKWYQENAANCETIACIDTIKTMCDPVIDSPPCVEIIEESIRCNPDNPYEYFYCFKVVNNSAVAASDVILHSLPAGFEFGLFPNGNPAGASVLINLDPDPLLPGATSNEICVKIIATNPVLSPVNICFHVGLLDENFQYCCHSPEEVCVTLEPCCNPCEDKSIVVENIMVDDGSCCAKIDLINDCPYQVFTRIETEVLTPGVVFGYHALGGPDAANWATGSSSTNTLISWEPIGGYVPAGTIDDIIQFCLDDIDDPSEQPQKVVLRWYGDTDNGEMVWCTDTLMFDCTVDNKCLEICDQEIVCDSTNSKYLYTFTAKNVSSIPFNATHIVVDIEDPTGLTLTPTGGIFPTTGTATTVTTCIESTNGIFPPAANQIVFKYRLLYWNGTSADTCCFENVLDTLSLPSCCLADLDCPRDTCIALEPGQLSAIVDFPVSPIDCENTVLTYIPPSGSDFPCGTTTVSCIALDTIANIADTCTFDVTIKCEPTCCQNEEEFKERVARGFNWTVDADSCKLTVTPNALDSCYQVYWTWEDGTTEGPTAWDEPICHYYDESGLYNVCMTVVELNGDSICWRATNCEPINVVCTDCKCDETVATDLATHILDNNLTVIDGTSCIYQVTNSVEKDTCYTTWIDWGTGNYEEIPNVNSITHTYTASGAYAVCLQVRLDDGTICATVCKEIEVVCEECDCEIIEAGITIQQIRTTTNRTCIFSYELDPVLEQCISRVAWTLDGQPISTSTSGTIEVTNGLHTITLVAILNNGEKCTIASTIECTACDCDSIKEGISITRAAAGERDCDYNISMSPANEPCIESIQWSSDFGFTATGLNPGTVSIPPGLHTITTSVVLIDGTICESSQIVSCSEAPCPTDTIIGGTIKEDLIIQVAETITSTSVLEEQKTVSFLAGRGILLQSGFQAPTGSRFRAAIDSCRESTLETPLLENPSIQDQRLQVEQLPSQIVSTIPSEKTILQIAPNPFSNQTVIQYFMPQQGQFQLSLRNMNGQLIETIQNRNKEKGWHEFTYQSKGLPPGIYYFVLQTDQVLISEKVVIHSN